MPERRRGKGRGRNKHKGDETCRGCKVGMAYARRAHEFFDKKVPGHDLAEFADFAGKASSHLMAYAYWILYQEMGADMAHRWLSHFLEEVSYCVERSEIPVRVDIQAVSHELASPDDPDAIEG